MKKLSLIIIALIAALVHLKAQTSVDLTATKDNEIWTGRMNDNYGTCNKLYINRANNQRGLIQFDLSSIPSNAYIISASFRFVKNGGKNGAHNISVHRLTNSWTEGTGTCADGTTGNSTWNNRTTGTAWGTAGGDFNSTAEATVSVAGNAAYTWNVRNLVQNWVNGTHTNYGLLVKFVTEGGGDQEKDFATRETGTATNRPRLLVNYSLPPSVTINVTNVSCFGGSNGALTTNVTGGSSPYTYNWGGGITTSGRTGLTAGSYTVTVTDALGATTTANAIVTQPAAALSGSVAVNQTVSCFGGSNGSITASATGGTSPYTYNWGGGITTAARTSLAAGTYTVTITDSRSCTTTANATVTQPAAALSGSVAVNQTVSCFGGSNGSITASASGGTSPYTYNWGGGITTAARTSLAAGTYTVTITDSRSCTTTANATVTQPAAALSGSVAVNQTVSCFGGSNGSITASATGGTSPYTYNWSGGITTAGRTGLAAGTYTVTITDTRSCTTTANATVTQPAAALSGSVAVNQTVSCFGGSDGSITASASGGTSPYTYNWGGGITTAGRTGLAAGTYTVTITDTRSCTTTANATVTQPAAALSGSVAVNQTVSCFGGSDGSITASASGGTSPYTYNWGGGITTAARTGLAAGTYTVTITDNIGCTTTANNTVTQPSSLSANITVNQHVNCDGCSNGSITASASGGTSPYTYNWGGGITTASRTSLAAGTYTVTVTDNQGCTSTRSTTVNQTNILPGYEFRKAITIDASKICGDNALANFPILIDVVDTNLRTLSNGGSVINSNGWDIIFSDSDGTSLLNHDVENYTASSGAYRAWVQIPSLPGSSDKTIYMYFGKSGNVSNPSTNNTWNNEYAGVWHLQDNFTDASTNSNNGTNYSTASATGKIGDARSFNGTNQYIDAGQNSSLQLTNGATVSAWVYRNGTDGHIINMGGGWSDYGYSLFWFGNSIRIELQKNGQKTICDNTAPSLNTWNHIAFTWSSTDNTIRTYINGVQAGNTSSFSAPIGTPTQTLQIGKNALQSGYLFGGFIDEARVLNTAKSDDWICTEYNNQNDPSTFYSVGDPESLIPAGTIIWRGTTNQNWSNVGNWSSNTVPTETDSVYVPAGTPNSLRLNGTNTYNVNHIYFDSLATLSSDTGATLNIKGNIHVNSCGFDVNNGHVKFSGSVAQYIYAPCKTAFYRLYLENTSGTGVYLSGASVQVDHELYLRDGYLYTGDDTIIVARTDAYNSIKEYNEDESHVVGYLTRYLTSNNNTYAFPVGKGSNTSSFLISIKNNNMEGVSQLTATFRDLDADSNDINNTLQALNISENGLAYDKMCSEGMWTIEPDIQPTAGSYNILADMKNFSTLNTTDFGLLKKPTGSQITSWSTGNGILENSVRGTVGQLINGVPTTVHDVLRESIAQRSNLTSFSDFGMGANSGGSLLPIELIHFSGKLNRQTKSVDLTWSTSTEINNEVFEVERSQDGETFEEIGRVAGAGNSSSELQYLFTDKKPLKGIAYYRLKQVDFDGTFTYTHLVSVSNIESSNANEEVEVSLFPNPTNGLIKIFIPTDQPEVQISIFDYNGNVVKSVIATNENSNNIYAELDLRGELSSGVYLLKVATTAFSITKKIQVINN